MNSILSATHLLRHFVLFTLSVVFLLTMTRAGYSLWQFPKVLEANVLVDMFVTGLRFDLALVGLVLLVPVLLGSFFGMFNLTRGLAKLIVILWLSLGMMYVLLTELVTPYFIAQQGVRPDVPLILSVENPLETIATLWSGQLIPAIIGVVLAVLILIAFWTRLETSRLLRFRLSRLSALALMLVGGALCLLAIHSSIDPKPTRLVLSPGDALVSTDVTVNDIVLNTGYKTAFSVVLPLINAASDELPKNTN